jgi:hypothetical protein
MAGPGWARPSRLQAATKPGPLDSDPLLFNAENAEGNGEDAEFKMNDSAPSSFVLRVLRVKKAF